MLEQMEGSHGVTQRKTNVVCEPRVPPAQLANVARPVLFLVAQVVRITTMSALTAAAAFDLPHPPARQSVGQAQLLEDARGWEGY